MYIFSTLKKILEKFHVFSIQLLLLLACHISVLHFLWLVNQYWYVTQCPYFMRLCLWLSFYCPRTSFRTLHYLSHRALHWIVQCLKSPMFLMTLTVLRCIGQLSSQSVPLIRIHLIRIYGFLGKDQKCKGLFSSYPQGYLLSTYLKLLHVCAWLSGFSTVWLFATLWTVARQAPLSKGFSR